MHIVHLVDALYLGGAERMLVELANRAVADGHRITVCVSRSGTTLVDRLDSRIELVILGRKRTTDIAPLRRFARLVRTSDVDVIHCHGRSSFALTALLRALRLISSPLVMHDHRGIELDATVPTWFRVAKHFASAYVAVYSEQLEWARKAGIAPDRTRMIPNAVDLAAVSRARVTEAPLPDTGTAKRLISVGGIRREKAIDVLLDSIGLVSREVHLFVVGGDADAVYAAQCRARAAAPDIAGRVTFVGAREDAIALAATADLAVHSSRAESGPLVLIEYAAVRVPFVSTRVGGIAKELARAHPARFVEPDDARALAAAIDNTLAAGPDEARRNTDSLYHLAFDLFDISRVMHRWYATYEQVRKRT